MSFDMYMQAIIQITKFKLDGKDVCRLSLNVYPGLRRRFCR